LNSKTDRMQQLSNYKISIMKRLVESQELCKALYYNVLNFLDMPNIQDPYSLFYTKIYPYKFEPSTNDKTSLITMEISNYSLVRNAYKVGFIYIYAIVNKDIDRTDIGWLRKDYLCYLVDQQINQMRGVGVGKLQFNGSFEVKVNDYYDAKCNEYKFYEFN